MQPRSGTGKDVNQAAGRSTRAHHAATAVERHVAATFDERGARLYDAVRLGWHGRGAGAATVRRGRATLHNGVLYELHARSGHLRGREALSGHALLFND